jgi:hypothetical protein
MKKEEEERFNLLETLCNIDRDITMISQEIIKREEKITHRNWNENKVELQKFYKEKGILEEEKKTLLNNMKKIIRRN